MDGDDRCVTECRPLKVGVLLTSSIALDPDPSLLQLDLPDPEQDDISTMEFLARLEQAQQLLDALVIAFFLATAAKVYIAFLKCDFSELGWSDSVSCFVYNGKV